MSDPQPQDRASSSARAASGATSLTLLQRVRDKDPDAWQRLFHLYRPLVLHWCTRAGIRPPDNEDVVQETFQAVAASLESFRRDRPGDTFRGWLRGITRHVIASSVRRVQQQAQASGGSTALKRLEQVADPLTDQDDDSPEQISGLYRRGLELVRSEFEERTWQAFWLTAVEDRSPAAVAAQLGVTPAAVRQSKSRVLRRLKEEVGDLIQ
jgi:RNA polymerase sigma-70 factor (ECF subfamily)